MDLHPLQAWLDRESVSYEEAARRCKRLGLKTNANYLQQIAKGYYCPSYRVAAFLAHRLCEDAFTVDDIAGFAYTIRRCTWAA